MRSKVYVAYFPGTNCEEETMQAFRNAGASPELLLLSEAKADRRVTDCDLFCFPGGFSYGDYIGPGAIAASMFRDQVAELLESGVPILGICNGFQIMIRAGMFGSSVTLTMNDSGTFCSAPMKHRVESSNCLWTKGLEGDILSFPAAHGGGKVVYTEQPNVVLTYAGKSPNGGPIAGICSSDGRIFGLMDHPERRPDNSDGQKIFKNGVDAVQ